MPIALDPNETVDVVLPGDAEKPAESRPTFIARYLTSREKKVVEKLVREASADIEKSENIAKLDAALALQLVGWRNLLDRQGQPIAFEVVKDSAGSRLIVDDVLTDEERFDLCLGALTAVGMGELDKKKSRWHARSAGSATTPSAPTATTAASASDQGKAGAGTETQAPTATLFPVPSVMDGDQTIAPDAKGIASTPSSSAPSSS